MVVGGLELKSPRELSSLAPLLQVIINICTTVQPHLLLLVSQAL